VDENEAIATVEGRGLFRNLNGTGVEVVGTTDMEERGSVGVV